MYFEIYPARLLKSVTRHRVLDERLALHFLGALSLRDHKTTLNVKINLLE